MDKYRTKLKPGQILDKMSVRKRVCFWNIFQTATCPEFVLFIFWTFP
jgi:hypothetical protein